MREPRGTAVILALLTAVACGGDAGDAGSAADTAGAAAARADEACAPLTSVPADSMREIQDGLLARTLSEGEGPAAQSDDTVRVHYLGCLTNGTKFDASYDRGEPFTFRLGAGRVIRGWDLGVVGMKPGETRLLRIRPELAYGERGTPGGPVPPDATLLFRIERVGAPADTAGGAGG